MEKTPEIPPKGRKLLDQVSDAIRVKHYSLRTEDTYKDWIKRYILFHKKRHPKDMGVEEIEAFITHLAVERHLAASSQNQALSAVKFLYVHVLHKEIDLSSSLIQAEKSKTLPVILTHPEAMAIIGKMTGTTRLWQKSSTAAACASWNVCACASKI
jgi:site-specific recombinase XerD